MNPKKCSLLVYSGIILGHVVFKVGKFPDKEKIEVIPNTLGPRKLGDVHYGRIILCPTLISKAL